MSRPQYRVSNVRLRAASAINPETELVALVDFEVDEVRVEGITLHYFEQGFALYLPTVFSYWLRRCPYGPPLPDSVLQGIAEQVLRAREIKPLEPSS